MAETRYVRSGDAHLAYQVVGSGDLDIVLVPGWFSHVELAWDVPGLTRFIRGLAQVGRVILFDKRGTGMSDRVPPDQLPSFEERTEDILAVMDAAGSEQAALVGLSEGGTQSLLAAVRHPDRVRAVVVIGSWARMLEDDGFPIGVSRERLDATLARILANWGSGDDIRLFLPSRRDDEQVRTAWATLERRAASPGAVETYGRMLFEMDVRDVLGDVAVPTLVVHATGDRVVPIAQGRFLADHVPNARFVELASDDHLPWFDQVETTLAEVEAFLTGRVQPHHVERALAAILMTDIVGSTDQVASEGDRRWRDRLDAYDALADRIVERHGGRVVKSTGDGTLARFDDPHAAVQAARSLEDEVGPVGVRVRAGVHCGQVEVRGDDVGGIAVHIAARVADQCPAGAVLVSQTVRDLLLGSDLDLQPHGEAVELRGVPGPWQLYVVDGPARAAAVRPAGAAEVDGATWLPPDFEHPTHVPLPSGHHLRPIRADDVELDMVAVMGSQTRLWSIYGRAWGWPPADMTAEQDRADLARHAAEMEAHESFNYALFDADETALLGCVYIDPPEKVGADAEISWWVVDERVGSDLEAELDAFVPHWIATRWPLGAPRHVGRDLTWDAWLALPDIR